MIPMLGLTIGCTRRKLIWHQWLYVPIETTSNPKQIPKQSKCKKIIGTEILKIYKLCREIKSFSVYIPRQSVYAIGPDFGTKFLRLYSASECTLLALILEQSRNSCIVSEVTSHCYSARRTWACLLFHSNYKPKSILDIFVTVGQLHSESYL